MARYTSADGLMSSSDPQAVALWESIGARMENNQFDWTERLRSAGIKLAHPDDGWVNRERNTFSLSWYAQFNDSPEVGDLIAFGTPPDREHYQSWHDVWRGRRDTYARERMERLKGEPESSAHGYRICRVTEVEARTGILGRHVTYAYEDTGVRLPHRAPQSLSAKIKRAFVRS